MKRNLLKDVERYDRSAQAKKETAENCDRLNAATSLLDLSNVGNGAVYLQTTHRTLHNDLRVPVNG